MKLLIPSHCVVMTGDVQRVLLLAKQQGLHIDHIELGVSPTQHFHLVADTTLRLSSNLFVLNHLSLGSESAPDLCIDYIGAGSHLTSSLCPAVATVAIGVAGCNGLEDTWWYGDEQRRLIHLRALTAQQQRQHLTWLLSLLALDFALEDALVLSRAALNVSRETWPRDYRDFPQPEPQAIYRGVAPFALLDKTSLGLYPVVDDVRWIATLLPLGIKTIQLRIKDPAQADLEQQIIQAIALGREHGAQVFINDYWQLALKHGAFGVHLGQEDLLLADLAAIAKAGIRLGLSTHGYFELLRIHQLAPSYIALGHIFPTTTKQMPSKPQGLVRLKRYQSLLDSLPYGEHVGVPSVAIGGIDRSNAAQVLECGVSSIAVVRAITQAEDVGLAVSQLQRFLPAPASVTEAGDVK
ncbi:thiamine phosphate synthase [Vibrio sp. H11]|uniref:thiamine phosphate synthase n=1 Tax=Vibrio sp. H11 TaxID=2565928 RepID=UPI0010A5C296|nr:thiamine phosphate synthase [Vibrio sp. H11]